MRKFDYSAFPGALFTPEISNLLSAILNIAENRIRTLLPKWIF